MDAVTSATNGRAMNCDLCGVLRDLEHVCLDALKEENSKLRARVEWLEKTNFMRLRADLQERELQVAELQKVVDGCKDTLVQFCGNGGAVIAHPPKCRFYTQGRQQDCNCNAKNTANDVMLSLRACREILSKIEKR